jgi:hypothetical protein
MSRTAIACIALLGCQSPDYSVGKLQAANVAPPRDVDLVIDVAWQDNNWGESTTRCQVQVAFEPVPDTVEGGSGAEGGGQPEQPRNDTVTIPDQPGTCAVSHLSPPGDPDAAGGEPGSPGGSSEEPADGADGGNSGAHEDGDTQPGDADDDWQVRGGLLGPDEVFVTDDLVNLTLDGVMIDGGGLRYELADCDADHFPFSSSLALDVAASSDPQGVHAFEMDDLIAVGPRLTIEAPLHDEHTGFPEFRTDQDLPVRWAFDGDDPVVDGEPATPAVLIKLFVQDETHTEGERWLVCAPDQEGWFDIPAADLADLYDGIEEPERWRTSLDVHSELAGREQETPWGELMQVRAHVSSGAPLQHVLVEGAEGWREAFLRQGAGIILPTSG